MMRVDMRRTGSVVENISNLYLEICCLFPIPQKWGNMTLFKNNRVVLFSHFSPSMSKSNIEGWQMKRSAQNLRILFSFWKQTQQSRHRGILCFFSPIHFLSSDTFAVIWKRFTYNPLNLIFWIIGRCGIRHLFLNLNKRLITLFKSLQIFTVLSVF